LSEKAWLECETLEDFLFSTKREPHVALMNAKLVRVRGDIYRRYRHRRILETLRRYVPEGSELIELGAGVGGNLFGLAYHQAPWKLTGLELTPSGIACGRAIAAKYKLPIDFDQIDLLDASSPGFSRLAGKPVFTYYCLEQLPHSTGMVLRNILNARPSRVVHIEPCYELLRPWKPLDAVTWLYIRSRDYQRSLLATLKAMNVEMLGIERLDYAASAQHFPMVVAWAPKKEHAEPRNGRHRT
jgi:hypothetical protein